MLKETVSFSAEMSRNDPKLKALKYHENAAFTAASHLIIVFDDGLGIVESVKEYLSCSHGNLRQL